jgi:type VI secretion system protein ImpJ
MTLDPHHFQQLDRHAQYVVNRRLRSVHPNDWGFLSLDIDRESLTNGQFALRTCSGVMQDGLLFDLPTNGKLPQAQSIKEHFPPSLQRLSVFLALPSERSRGGNCQIDGSAINRETRFSLETLTVPDDNTGTNEREIGVSQPNFKFLFADESQEEYSVLQIAQVVRTADGAYSLSDTYIPPSLSISASSNLMRTTRSLLELLVAKSNALSDRRRQQPTGQIEFTTSDVTLLGVLQTINSSIPHLNYFYSVGKHHPEMLYSLLLSVAGQLMTFSPDQDMRPSDLPFYDHANAAQCFGTLDTKISRLLEIVMSSNFVRVSMEKSSENQWVGRIPDNNLLINAQFYLAVGGEIPERKVIDELPSKIKVGGPDDVPTLVAAALPGLPITFSARSPVGLPTRAGLQYFRLEKTGRLWDAILRNNSIAFFVPADFRGIQLELYAIKTG